MPCWHGRIGFFSLAHERNLGTVRVDYGRLAVVGQGRAVAELVIAQRVLPQTVVSSGIAAQQDLVAAALFPGAIAHASGVVQGRGDLRPDAEVAFVRLLRARRRKPVDMVLQFAGGHAIAGVGDRQLEARFARGEGDGRGLP